MAVSRPSKSNNFSVGSTAKTLASMVSILVLWTRVMVRKLIADKFGANFGVTAVGKLLARLDRLTPQKPLKRAYERAILLQLKLGRSTPIQARKTSEKVRRRDLFLG